jgi:hypothetical protein
MIGIMNKGLGCLSVLLAASIARADLPATTRVGFTSGAYLTIPATGTVEKAQLMERERDVYDSIQTFKNASFDILLMEVSPTGQTCKDIMRDVLHAPSTGRSRRLKIEALKRHGLDLVREDVERRWTDASNASNHSVRSYSVCKGKTYLRIGASPINAAAAANANLVLDRAIDSLVVP